VSAPDGSIVPITSVDELLTVLAAGRDLFDGDPVDLLDHALQCAHELAMRRPDDDEMQVAGLVHDLGHHLVPGDDPGHGANARAAIGGLLGDRVATLVEHHVAAKRYLVATDPQYAALLSPASVRTLGNQGGTMTPDELHTYASLPHWEDGLEVRRADDAAKVPGRVVPDLHTWRPLLERVAARAATR
jgi:predicted HD phosphohydrolase